jgi:hypothetical protein
MNILGRALLAALVARLGYVGAADVLLLAEMKSQAGASGVAASCGRGKTLSL